MVQFCKRGVNQRYIAVYSARMYVSIGFVWCVLAFV